MSHRVLLWSMLFVFGLAAGAQAADSVKVKGSCSGDPDAKFQAQATIDNKKSEVKLKFSGSGFPPSTGVTCGYVCAEGGAAHIVGCGSTDDKGKWKFQQTLIDPAPCDSVALFGLSAAVGSQTCGANIQ